MRDRDTESDTNGPRLDPYVIHVSHRIPLTNRITWENFLPRQGVYDQNYECKNILFHYAIFMNLFLRLHEFTAEKRNKVTIVLRQK